MMASSSYEYPDSPMSNATPAVLISHHADATRSIFGDKVAQIRDIAKAVLFIHTVAGIAIAHRSPLAPG
jgi:hypothetical protein